MTETHARMVVAVMTMESEAATDVKLEPPVDEDDGVYHGVAECDDADDTEGEPVAECDDADDTEGEPDTDVVDTRDSDDDVKVERKPRKWHYGRYSLHTRFVR